MATAGGSGFLGGAFIEIVVRTQRFERALRSVKSRFAGAMKTLGRFSKKTAKSGLEFLRRKLDRLAGGLRKIGKLVRRVLWPLMGVLAGLAVAKGVKDSISAFVEFEQKLGDINAIAPATAAEMDAIKEAALEMGRTTKFTATEAAGALEVLRKMGISTKDSIAALGPALQLASAGGITIAEAASISGSVMKSYGKSASAMAEINDVLAKTAATTKTSIAELGRALPSVASVAKSAGVPLEQVTAILGRMQDAGVDAAIAGTSLRNVLLVLGSGSKQQEEALRSLGVDIDSFRDGSIDLLDVLNQLEEGGFGFTNAAEAFGRRGGPQLLAALQAIDAEGNRGARSLLNLSNSLNDVGFAARAERKRLDTLRGSMTLLRSAWKDVQISFGEQWKTAIQRVSKALIHLAPTMKEALKGYKPIIDVLGRAFARLILSYEAMLKKMIPMMSKVAHLVAAIIADPIGALKSLWEVVKGGWNFLMINIKTSVISLSKLIANYISAGFLDAFAVVNESVNDVLPPFAKQVLTGMGMSHLIPDGGGQASKLRSRAQKMRDEADTDHQRRIALGWKGAVEAWELGLDNAMQAMADGFNTVFYDKFVQPIIDSMKTRMVDNYHALRNAFMQQFFGKGKRKEDLAKAKPVDASVAPTGGGRQSGLVSFLQSMQSAVFEKQTQVKIEKNTNDAAKAAKKTESAVNEILNHVRNWMTNEMLRRGTAFFSGLGSK